MNRKYLLLSLMFLSTLPFLWLFTDSKYLGGSIYAFANISGFIGAILFMWQMALGIRGVLGKVTTDYAWSIKIHTLLGIYGTFFVFLHPILEMFSYLESWLFIFIPDFDSTSEFYISLGRFAFLIFILIWITSAIARDKMKFRPWLYIHYLTYPMIFLVLIHANQVGSYIQKYPLLQIYWYTLIALFFIMGAYKIMQFFNVGKQKYEVKDIKKLPGNNYIYTFKPLNKKLVPKPGQFFYVKNKFLGESHPFTIMNYKDNGELVFGVKAVGKFTNELANIKTGDVMFLDGPYGEFTKEAQNKNPKVLIAGGIGVTPFVEVVERFSDENTYMLYSNQRIENAIERDMFKGKLGDKYFDYISRDAKNGENIINSRIKKDTLPQKIKDLISQNPNFFICGNGDFNKGIKKMLIEVGVPKKNIFYEDFEF